MDENDRQGKQTDKNDLSLEVAHEQIVVFLSAGVLSSTLLCVFSFQYASEEAELLLVGNKLDCEADRIISRQQGERVGQHSNNHDITDPPNYVGLKWWNVTVAL